MEHESQTYEPLDYDEERLRLFYVRATHGTNLPRAYKPDFETVDLGAFADAIVGGYLDLTDKTHREDSRRHNASLGRIAFTINFLEGMPFPELNETIQDDAAARKKGVREFALGLAGEGARYLQETVLTDGKKDLEPKAPTETYVDITEFIDLDDTIKRLFFEERLSAGKAQALLLLFGLAQSNAPENARHHAVESICQDLKPRLRTAVIHQPHHGEKLIDQTFARGSMYIKTVLGASSGSRQSGAAISQLVDFEMNRDNLNQRVAAREQVYGHIGYVLDTIYPSR